MSVIAIPMILFILGAIVLAGVFLLALFALWREITRPRRHTRAHHALGKRERRR